MDTTNNVSAIIFEVREGLGEGWAVDASPQYADHRGIYLNGPDGARIMVSLDWRNGDRVEVMGCYPQGTYQNVYPTPENVKATVAYGRGGRAVAGAIVKRVLPTYLPELKRVRESLDAADAYERKSVEGGASLATVPGVTLDNAGKRAWFRSVGGSVYGDATVSGESVAVSLHGLTVDEARAILELASRVS